jgi:uncharacterized protein (DUF342 family)
MAVVVDCTLPEEDLEAFAIRLEDELRAQGISRVPPREELVAWLQQTADADRCIKGASLIEGRPPVAPVDGAVEWAANFFDSGFVFNEKTGLIDYRQRAAQQSVAEGQVLARISPPVPGQEGEDVFGKRVRVPKPKPVRLRPGENVRQDPAGTTLYAATSGRIRLDKRGAWDLLAVDKVFRIPGSVGLETGNINHPGALEIGRDILEGAKVQAEGDIDVRQTVEAADVDAGGNLTVRGGLTGRVGRKIRIEGSIHARFILDADIEAGGDIVVEREIVHSIVKTRGAIMVPYGRIVGGEAVALRGFSVGQAGSPGAIPTVLIAGMDYQLERKVAEKEARISLLEETLAKIQTPLKPWLSQIEAAGPHALSPEQRQAISSLLEKISEIRNDIEDLRNEVTEMRSRAEGPPNFKIEIRNVAYPETLFCVGKERLRLREEFRGSTCVVMHNEQLEIRAAVG